MKTITAACLAALLFAVATRAETRVVSTGKATAVRKGTADDTKPGPLATPSIRVSKVTGKSDGRAHYLVEVTNVEQYPAASFTPAGPSLPPNPCSETRMVALVMVRQGGETRKVSCKALPSRNSLQSIEFDLAKPLADADKVQFALQDRQAETHASSQWFIAGWMGIGSQLSPGCKTFLGRAGSFLCTDSKAFAECERLRISGKPIACTQAGQGK
jgi:hypothetical protein